MQQTILYRKRFIPNETICLKDDKIIVKNDAHIITKWNVFRPKLEFSKGVSCYFLKEGYKVSKFLNDDDALVYYYCDISDPVYDAKENAYYFTDLLVDVIIYPDGFVKVVDLAELADALDENIITEEMVKKALRRLEALLTEIYGGKLKNLVQYLEIEEL